MPALFHDEVAGAKEGEGSVTIRHSIEYVNPEKAQRWLDGRGVNRRISLDRVHKYAGAMLRGEWYENGVGVVFDDENRLVDGQHRLMAVVEAGVTLPMLVVRGVSPHAFATFDIGMPRSLGQILKMLGYKYSNELATLVNYVFVHASGHDIRTRTHFAPTFAQAIRTVEENPELQESVAVGVQVADVVRCSRVAMGFLHFQISVDEDNLGDRDVFFEELRSGEGLRKGNPVYALRTRLLADGRGPRRLTAPEQIALGIKAWNAWRAGEPVKQLTWRAGGARPEPFPELR